MADALDIVNRRAAEAEANRLAMPEVSRWVNLHDAQFGKSKVSYASERGTVKGRRPDLIEVSAAQMCLIIDGQQYVLGA